MSISTEIESLFASMKTKLSDIPAEVESYFSGKIEAAKQAEADEATREQGEIAHLESVGYTITKATLAEPIPVPVERHEPVGDSIA
jgi:hypothetical protein